MARKKVVEPTPQQKRNAENHAACLNYLMQAKEQLNSTIELINIAYKEIEEGEDSKWFESYTEDFRDKCWCIYFQNNTIDRISDLLRIIKALQNRYKK